MLATVMIMNPPAAAFNPPVTARTEVTLFIT
jgi:hypothetical protein